MLSVKKVLEEVGGFTTDTLAEDCDLTMCINERGYIIENENYAVAMTEVPETLRQFVKATHTLVFWRNANILETPFFVICNI